eukprot:3816139-Rhodomonas_salina.2
MSTSMSASALCPLLSDLSLSLAASSSSSPLPSHALPSRRCCSRGCRWGRRGCAWGRREATGVRCSSLTSPAGPKPAHTYKPYIHNLSILFPAKQRLKPCAMSLVFICLTSSLAPCPASR